MSAVIQRARRSYQKILKIEVGILAGVLLVAGGLGADMGSFLLGEFAALLPHCVFVYWVFFRQSVINPQSMATFYRGEGLKWLTTIIVIVVAFKSYDALHHISFFSGFFFTILCNSLLPIILKWHSK